MFPLRARLLGRSALFALLLSPAFLVPSSAASASAWSSGSQLRPSTVTRSAVVPCPAPSSSPPAAPSGSFCDPVFVVLDPSDGTVRALVVAIGVLCFLTAAGVVVSLAARRN